MKETVVDSSVFLDKLKAKEQSKVIVMRNKLAPVYDLKPRRKAKTEAFDNWFINLISKDRKSIQNGATIIYLNEYKSKKEIPDESA